MFDHEKMSEKDQERYAAEMSAEIAREKQAGTDFPPNCGAPLDPEAVKLGLTWDADTRKWKTHQSLGATVTSPPKGWRDLFGAPEKPRGLTVVSLAYDWKVWN
jgi:hypothetical protein